MDWNWQLVWNWTLLDIKKTLPIFSDILGGLSPEELSKEPSNIIDPMFDTLLELATNDQQNTDEEIRALASACLLSLSVAYGDTGRLKQGLLRC